MRTDRLDVKAIIIPGSWNGSRGNYEMTQNGLRIKQENAVKYFYVADFEGAWHSPDDEESEDFLIMEELIAAGVLK